MHLVNNTKQCRKVQNMKSLLFSKVTTINSFLYILWTDYFVHIAAYPCVAFKNDLYIQRTFSGIPSPVSLVFTL